MLVTRLNNGTIDIEVYQFGKSMYGGWYANFNSENGYNGIRRDKLSDLCRELNISRTALQRDVRRVDN